MIKFVKLLKHAKGSFDQKRPIGPVQWPHHDLFFVHKGTFYLIFEAMSREIELTAPSAVLIFPETHFHGGALNPESLASIQHFQIDSTASDQPMPFRAIAGRKGEYVVYKNMTGSYYEFLVERALRLSNEPNTELVYSARLSLLSLILCELIISKEKALRQTPEQKKFLSLIGWLRNNLHCQIGINDMASHVNMSSSHFRMMFRKAFNIPPHNYFKKMKFDHAKLLLEETRMPIKEIARQIGFEDISHFYRAFKQVCGTTPKKMREERISIFG